MYSALVLLFSRMRLAFIMKSHYASIVLIGKVKQRKGLTMTHTHTHTHAHITKTMNVIVVKTNIDRLTNQAISVEKLNEHC